MKKKRLLKLAEHLEKGKLGHKVFDFSTWNSGGRDSNPCGYAGCAIGECPIVFPKHWKFPPKIGGISSEPILRGNYPIIDPAYSAMKFFELDLGQFEYLFVPGGGETYENHLGPNATRKQVAKHIRRFVETNGEMPCKYL